LVFPKNYQQQNFTYLMGVIHRELFPGFPIGDFSPVQLMGVINLSPESFYKGSFIPTDKIETQIKEFLAAGAGIIDIGARSTAPGVTPISIAEEKARILAALQVIKPFFPKDRILSIDTQYAQIAAECIQWALTHNIRLILNDVSAFATDPTLMELVATHQIPVIIMASKQVPGDLRTVEEIMQGLARTIAQLEKRGYALDKLIIDPGVGRWIPTKTYEYDLAILDRLEEFRCFGCPILIGLSRKSFLRNVLNEPDPANRGIGSLAATSIAVYNGAHIIRTHDITEEMHQTLLTAAAIRRKPIQVKHNGQICEITEQYQTPEGPYHLLRQYGVTPAGSRIMKNKMLTKIIIIKNVTAPQGLILKQELLARGGDVGLHGQVITTEWKKMDECFDIVLMGTQKQLANLIAKLKGQQLKLDQLARILEQVLQKESETEVIYSTEYPEFLK
jgi:dihydropteroate synthase